ncbi:MAG: hypothetical protein GY704_15740, partial [Phycisphaeraceae bacterium]|nr:hypothetical protein [Phycisphaeraceae bacterium]
MTSLPWLRRTWQRLVVDHLRAIDAAPPPPQGRISVEARVTVVYIVGALVLALMSYGVLNHRFQTEIAAAVIALVGQIDPEWGAALEPYQPLLRIIAWSLGAFTFYFALPALVVRRIFGQKLSDYGLSLRGIRGHLWVYFVLFIPVFLCVLVVADAPDFQSKYPFYRQPIAWTDLAVWEL